MLALALNWLAICYWFLNGEGRRNAAIPFEPYAKRGRSGVGITPLLSSPYHRANLYIYSLILVSGERKFLPVCFLSCKAGLREGSISHAFLLLEEKHKNIKKFSFSFI